MITGGTHRAALVFSTYFGGNSHDEGFGVAVDSGGYTALAGKTHSTDLPVVNATQSVCTPPLPCYDAFVARINPTGSALVFSTYLGGSAGDEAQGIATDVVGGVYVTGRTWSTDFPTQSPIQPSFRGGDSDAFVVVYAPDGARGFGTYFGGTARDDGLVIAVDGDRSIYFAGSTSSTNFPTVLPVQAVYGGGDIDAYAVRLFPNGSSVAYSTFLGGNLSDTALAIDLLGDTDAYLAGGTRSTNFPLVSPYQAALRGSSEVFISRITDATPPHEEARAITYTYDPMYRLTAADYDDGTYFHYTYDAVGNRITETTVAGSTVYAYDDANRMTIVGGVPCTWSDNGNLLSDGTYTYAYDHASRLTSAMWGTLAYGFTYNGLGDRLRQTVNGTPTSYALDLAAGLTQVLSDGTNAYLYGVNRIGEDRPGGWQYHLGDALGSVRQLADASVNISLTSSYEPFGDPLLTSGAGSSIYAFAGEQRDGTGLVYLRARYYGPYLNQWIQPDPIVADPYIPADWNRYAYVRNNPVNYTDPAGMAPCSLNYRYCILDAGGFVDVHHWDSSYHIAERLLREELPDVIGRPFTSFRLDSVKLQNVVTIARTYWTNIPAGTPQETIERIGLGIMMNYQTHVETVEALAFWCYAGIGHCSAFSNEDLPSDYLGYVSYVHGFSIQRIAELLDGGSGSNTFPEEYLGEPLGALRCLLQCDCDETTPYNRGFTLKVLDELTGSFINRPWPPELRMSPIGPGRLWATSFWDLVYGR